jgi:hypothetical protein
MEGEDEFKNERTGEKYLSCKSDQNWAIFDHFGLLLKARYIF